MKTKQIEATSFTDTHGATVSIPADQAAFYAIVKTEQVAVLTDFISNHTAGFQIDLSEADICTFAALASELAHAAKSVVVSVAERFDVAQKVGE